MSIASTLNTSFRLGQPFESIATQLHFINHTYYEKIGIYKVNNELCDANILGIDTHKMEVGFNDGMLVSIWWFFKNKEPWMITGRIEEQMGLNFTLNEISQDFRLNDTLRFYVKNKSSLLGVGERGGVSYLYYTDKNFILPVIFDFE